MPLSRLSRSRRSRICAWMVTSSAVVGSSAIRSFGRQASAMAIMTRWLMPPESWCGKAARAAGGIGDADFGQQLDDPRLARLAGEAEMGLQRLADLEADGEAGVQRRHRLLEDHRHVLAGEAAALVGARASSDRAVERHAVGGDGRGLRQKAHRRQHRHRLAGARFADDRQHLVAVDRRRRRRRPP